MVLLLAWEYFFQSVTKSDFRKYSGLNSALLTEYITESAFSRASSLYCKGQCKSVWLNLFLDLGVEGSFLIKLQVFAINGSEGFYDGVPFEEGSSL